MDHFCDASDVGAVDLGEPVLDLRLPGRQKAAPLRFQKSTA
jgi:hypothetical protein